MTAIHHFWLSASPYSAVVVSGLFPAFAADGLAPALSLNASGTLVEMPRPLETVTAALVPTGGSLLTMLAGAQDNGAIRPALALGASTLVVGVRLINPAAEAVSPALAVSGGSLVSGLISIAYAAEAVSPALGVTSGTLT